MYKMDNITGVEFCSVEEFVDDAQMKQLGFEKIQVTGVKRYCGENITAYYYKEDCPYVYAECYIAKLDAYTKLIIDKEKFEKLGMKDKAIVLNTGKGDGTRAVPSIGYNNIAFPLHKCGHEGKEVDHIGMSLNIITEDSLRECSTNQNSRNKKNLHTWGMSHDGNFFIYIEEKIGFLSETDIKELRRAGFTVKIGSKNIKIRKSFVYEIDAIRELRNYEVGFYREYAFNPLNDMRGHFEAKFEQLILGTKSEDDVTREILADYSNDAVLIARYNLEKEYQSRGMEYNTGNTCDNGRFVS